MHKHLWKIESTVTQQAPVEMLRPAGVAPIGDLRVPADFFKQPVIVTYTCETCGSQKVERV